MFFETCPATDDAIICCHAVILQCLSSSSVSAPPASQLLQRLSSSSVSAPPASQLLQQLSSDRDLVWNKQRKSCFNMWASTSSSTRQGLQHDSISSFSMAPPSAPSAMDSWSGYKHSWSHLGTQHTPPPASEVHL
ncbi:unnamed protein product [Boreogadus saida]